MATPKKRNTKSDDVRPEEKAKIPTVAPKKRVAKSATNNTLDSTAEVALAVLDKVPIYEDAIQPLAKQLGRTLDTIWGGLNTLLAPVVKWSYKSQIALQEYKDSLVNELKDVPAERLITPNKVVAGPLLEALRYAVDEPDLRAMYSKLLATSMDSKTAHEAFPAFVDIIRQLTPDEARIVRLFADSDDFPMVRVLHHYTERVLSQDYFQAYESQMYQPNQHTSVTRDKILLDNFNLIGEQAEIAFPQNINTYLDNLCRLRLTMVLDPQSMLRTVPKRFDELFAHLTVIEARAQSGEGRTSIHHRLLTVTDLGRHFCRACVLPHDSLNKQH